MTCPIPDCGQPAGTHAVSRFTQDHLLCRFAYDPSTGALFWRERDGDQGFNSRFAGKPALTSLDKRGYRTGTFEGIAVKAHQIIWKLMTGENAKEIDHINGVKSDNRFSNLRSVEHSQNMRNVSLRRTNASGVTGVIFDKQTGKWRAYISRHGKKVSLGRFANKTDAAAARAEAERDLGFYPDRPRAMSGCPGFTNTRAFRSPLRGQPRGAGLNTPVPPICQIDTHSPSHNAGAA